MKRAALLRRAIPKSPSSSSSSSSSFFFTNPLFVFFFLPNSSSSSKSPIFTMADSAANSDSSSSTATVSTGSAKKEACYQWCVVGAGPAGIATVGLLLDSCVPPQSIAWVDPNFNVGDFGTKWKHVSSNTTVGLFLKFYQNCPSFEFSTSAAAAASKSYAIQSIPEKHTCLLDVAAEPLHDITRVLRSKIPNFQATVQHLKERNGVWECTLNNMSTTTTSDSTSTSMSTSSRISSANVVLATGAIPRTLPFHNTIATTTTTTIDVIPMTVALNPNLLATSIDSSDTVAVFGSSHSAVMLIRHLLELTHAKKVINFYREPLRYALYMGDWILFDDTGLKGDTARWSREHLHGDLPHRLQRVYSDDESVARFLPDCTKVIYATGFERRPIPEGIEGLAPHYSYNAHCGIIAPGLFGCGIGYPEQRTDRFGNVEMRVGLWKFMDYLQGVIPLWKQYSVSQGIGQPKGAPGTEETKSS